MASALLFVDRARADGKARRVSSRGTRCIAARTFSEPAHDVARPCAALHQREDEQNAHGQVLEGVGEAAGDAVYRGPRAGIDCNEPAQDEGERDEQDEDDQPRYADRGEVLDVADADLARVVERHEGQRYRAERRHDVELQRPRPADHEAHDVRDEDHEPADEGDEEHGDQGRQVVVGGDDRDVGEIERPSRSEQRYRPVYRQPDDLVDRLHELEAVLDEEEEHCEEDEQEHDLLHTRQGLVAVHPLRYLYELDGEHEREDPASDREDRDLPHRVHYVVHGGRARCREHVAEIGAQDPVVADRLEDVHLLREDPVAAVAQHPAKPGVYVVGYARPGALRGEEENDAGGEGDQEGPGEAAPG